MNSVNNLLFNLSLLNNQNKTPPKIDRTSNNSWCSTYLESKQMILKGEFGNPDSKIRGGYVKAYELNQATPKAFLRTNKKNYIFSVKIANFKNQEFILVSGNGHYLDIFNLTSPHIPKFIGKPSVFNIPPCS
jgi:hypothetical protein